MRWVCAVLSHRWWYVLNVRVCGRCGAVDRWEVIRGSRNEYDWHPAGHATRDGAA